jgi:glycine C-acetyltransferase
LFETLLGPEDAVISDELNHASIIDGIRLCRARRYRYQNNNLADLEAKLNETVAARFRLIATDGVFSMDGHIANLAGICAMFAKVGCVVDVQALTATADFHTRLFYPLGGLVRLLEFEGSVVVSPSPRMV